jgi:transcriptional regulator with XRE-family HTH domain
MPDTNNIGKVETFTQRLNSTMEELCITQADLARATGISKQQISQYARGDFTARSKRLFALAKALNVSERWLAGYDAPKERAVSSETYERWENTLNPDGKLLFEVKEIENFMKNWYNMITSQFGEDVIPLLDNFTKLNGEGKKEAVKRLSELAALSQYVLNPAEKPF